jgi:hypothetical protein
MCYSQKTMPQSLCIGLSKQSYDSSTGQAERATVERRIVAGHLQDTVGLSKERYGGNGNKRFILFISFNT